ncbi:MAG: co-chaperone GroES [Dehalococcoidia bacterium]|nr:co-chaperone GroES [Dehalococcoidia bacterium]
MAAKVKVKEAVVARKIQPLGDRVLVKAIEQSEVMRGGIILPDTAKEKPQEGVVIAVGPGRVTDDGKLIPTALKAGDKVIYAKYGGTEIKEDRDEFLILRESDVLAKVS